MRRTGVEIGSDNRRRDGKFLNPGGMEPCAYELADTVVTGYFRPRLAETDEVTNPHATPESAEFVDGNPVSICSAEQASDTGAGDRGDRNSFLFKDFEDTQMCEPAGEAAAQCERDACCVVGTRLPALAQRIARLIRRFGLCTAQNCHKFSLTS